MKSPLIISLLALLLAACASIGSPDGGRFDEQPPYVVATTPLDKATGQQSVKKVRITFNEFIKLENASEKVIISPPQQEQPDIYTSGKSVVIRLFDTLQTATTYTIDFGDAIQDNNEGNPMGNYTYSFSTGTEIDTLEINGHVLRADNLEPLKGILVGTYRIDTLQDVALLDSLLTNRRMERVSRTNEGGQFSIKGVAPGSYRVFALADMDGDYMFSQRSEMLAFDTTVYVPSHTRDLRHDTVWIDSTHYERILHTPYTRFLPDDIVLRAFLEDGQPHHKLKDERKDPYKMTFYFTSPADSLPVVEFDGADAREALWVQTCPTRDTVTYWIVDTALAHRDTLSMRMTYLDSDSTDTLVPLTDTLAMVPKLTRAKQVADLEAQVDKWVKQQKKRREQYEKKLAKFQQQYPDSVYPRTEQIDTARAQCPLYTPPLTLSMSPSGSLSPLQNPRFVAAEPLALIDTARLSFTRQVDTLWVPEPYVIERDSLDPCAFVFYAEWQPDTKYKIQADSLTFCSVYGKWAAKTDRTISVSGLDAYGSLFVKVEAPAAPEGEQSPCVVQLIDKSDKVLREAVADSEGRADFFFLSPSTIYLRCFIDLDRDGQWTSGKYSEGRQPEPVYYFPQPFTIKAKWELEQAWRLDAIETLRQKPSELIKQKAKKNKRQTAHERNIERERKK